MLIENRYNTYSIWRMRMDNFMDKLAQKFNASELIKANSQAEAEEMKRLQKQVAAYESILQEVRKLNLKNVEVTEHIETQVERLTNVNAVLDEIKTIQSENKKEEPTELLEETKKILEEGQLKIEELFKASDEYVHRENVKVYRNVQAVIVDEIKNQTEGLTEEVAKIDSKVGLLKILTIGTIALSVINTVLIVIQMLF